MRLHFVDARGGIHLRPFAYAQELRTGSFDQYEENTARAIPMRFFVRGASYRVLGVLPLRWHLFGTDAPVYLLGRDGYGRDLLSRVLFGGQVSLLAGLIGAGLTLLIGLWIGAAGGFWGGGEGGGVGGGGGVFFGRAWGVFLFW